MTISKNVGVSITTPELSLNTVDKEFSEYWNVMVDNVYTFRDYMALISGATLKIIRGNETIEQKDFESERALKKYLVDFAKK